MATVRLATEVVTVDLERIADHLRAHDVEGIDERLGGIFEAFEILERHPLIGRPVQGDRRELVIGTGSRGYVASYRYEALDDTVEVLALRAQREVGFQDR
jgi:toxin ParE1/3/4